MNILDRLSDMRRNTPGCVLIALSDLSSGIVLCSSSVVRQPQERLDAIAKTAVNLLDDGMPAPLAMAESVSEVVAMNPSNTQIFIRSPMEAHEALCCVCEVSADVDGIMQNARTLLCDLSASA